MTEFSTVAELLADPKRWTKNHSARDATGTPCIVDDKHAACWCLYGALVKVYGKNTLAFDKARCALELSTPIRAYGITGWNDNKFRTHADVLRVVQEAGI